MNTKLVAVCVDPVEQNLKVSKKLGLGFPILSDEKREMIKAWGVVHPGGGMGEDIARPATFLVGPDGKILWRSLTENWRVRVRPEYLFEALARTSHQSSTAVGDAQSPAALSLIAMLDGQSSTTARPSGRKHRWALHLPALATNIGERCGLEDHR